MNNISETINPGLIQTHNCFLPPYILEKVAHNHPDPEIRNIALQNIQEGSQARAHRTAAAQLTVQHLNIPKAKKQKTHRPVIEVYTTDNSSALPGKMVDPVKTKDNTAKEAYSGAVKVYDFYKNNFNRNSIDGKGLNILSTVHYKKNYDNAFWDGQQMVYGDGDKIFNRFTSALDVIGHELTHGVTQYTCDLVYEGQSGGLNESISDIFGILIKQADKKWTVASPDAWLIGDELLKDNPHQKVALRSLSAPGTAYVNHPYLGTDPQFPTMDQYKEFPKSDDDGGVHTISGVPNHAFYLMCAKLGTTNEPGKIIYDTIQNIKSTTNFAQFAEATANSAVKLYGKGSKEESAVRGAWNEVKVTIYK